jgi:hypothetical protein
LLCVWSECSYPVCFTGVFPDEFHSAIYKIEGELLQIHCNVKKKKKRKSISQTENLSFSYKYRIFFHLVLYNFQLEVIEREYKKEKKLSAKDFEVTFYQ